MAVTASYLAALLVFLLLFGLRVHAVSLSGTRPNILVVLADGLGYGEIEVFPSDSTRGRIRTPYLKELSMDGMTFTDAYGGGATAMGARCSLLTGRHSGHAPIRGYRLTSEGHNVPMSLVEPSLASILKGAGRYRTAYIGQWELGFNGTGGDPLSSGFSSFYGVLDSNEAVPYFPSHVWEDDTVVPLPANEAASYINVKKNPLAFNYSVDLYVERAVATMNKYKSGRPWFMVVALGSVGAGTYNYRDASSESLQSPINFFGMYQDEKWPDGEKDHATVVSISLDQAIGRLLQALTESGQHERTLVVVASATGAMRCDDHSPQFFDSSGPLRGEQFSMFEGGLRSPTIVRWPGSIAAGVWSSQVWALWDLFPTFLDLAGVLNVKARDGVSIVPLLEGTEWVRPETAPLYFEYVSPLTFAWSRALRSGDWKWVSSDYFGTPMLFNVTNDAGEAVNLADDHPDVLAMLNELAASQHFNSSLWPTYIDASCAVVNRCARNASCLATGALFACVCDEGFEGDGSVCTTIQKTDLQSAPPATSGPPSSSLTAVSPPPPFALDDLPLTYLAGGGAAVALCLLGCFGSVALLVRWLGGNTDDGVGASAPVAAFDSDDDDDDDDHDDEDQSREGEEGEEYKEERRTHGSGKGREGSGEGQEEAATVGGPRVTFLTRGLKKGVALGGGRGEYARVQVQGSSSGTESSLEEGGALPERPRGRASSENPSSLQYGRDLSKNSRRGTRKAGVEVEKRKNSQSGQSKKVERETHEGEENKEEAASSEDDLVTAMEVPRQRGAWQLPWLSARGDLGGGGGGGGGRRAVKGGSKHVYVPLTTVESAKGPRGRHQESSSDDEGDDLERKR